MCAIKEVFEKKTHKKAVSWSAWGGEGWGTTFNVSLAVIKFGNVKTCCEKSIKIVIYYVQDKIGRSGGAGVDYYYCCVPKALI